MNKELLPCPFCGSSANVYDIEYKLYSVGCNNDNCGASIEYLSSKKAAAELWNKRSLDAHIKWVEQAGKMFR